MPCRPRTRLPWPGCALLAVLLCGLVWAGPGDAETGRDPGDAKGLRTAAPAARIKAAVAINIARFFTWPESALGATNQPFRIGILGADPFGDHLRLEAAAATVQGRTVSVVRARQPEDLKRCHLVFVSPDRDLSLKESLAAFEHQPVLLVGDEPDFARRGGMVNLRLRGDQLSLEIRRDRVESAGLGIRASLRQVRRIEWITEPQAP